MGNDPEFARLRIRNDNRRRYPSRLPASGSPAMLGKVTTATASIGVGKFLGFNPVTILGSEVAGSSPVFEVQTGATLVGELLQGTAKKDDILLFKHVSHHWVTDGKGGATCSSLPENLYLASNYWTGKVAFNYDAGSSLWVAGVMVTGNVHDESVPGCASALNINQTAMIYQMNTAGVLIRRCEAISVFPAPITTKCVQNTMPGSLTSTTPFGPNYGGWVSPCNKGTHSQGKNVACTCCPLTLTISGVTNAPGFGTENLTVSDTP